MANRQTYVIGALGVLVGMVVGANSAQRADIVSYSGHNPNNVEIQNMGNLRRSAGIVRQRSDEEARGPQVYRLTRNRTSGNSVESRLEQRLNKLENLMRSASKDYTVRGAPAIRQRYVHGCSQYSGQRYTHCLEAVINGEPYVPNYFTAPDYE